ncbi:MAG: TonB-dependent receptor [Chitinophagaceae bacterium]|nr:TonB-dependent receptor [Chitinophagaceae bacterium]
MKNNLLLCLVMLFCISFNGIAQRVVTGKVQDAGDGSPIPAVNIIVQGTSVGTTTDLDGNFRLEIASSIENPILVFSYISYTSQEVAVPASNYLEIKLEASTSQLDEIVVSTGRGAERTITDTPLPIDNITFQEMQTTGQVSFDRALQYRIPSFNTVNTPVNDATSLLDPYEIRNLGPSRTLILINGKRKNLSSLVYTQTSPGRGETGADLSAIPSDAIARVEILRDGASAQYGSDAIAGVMNIILKDKFEYSDVKLNMGLTHQGDGALLGVNLNSGANFGNKGYFNYHISFTKQTSSNRPGTVDANYEASSNGFGDDTPATTALIKKFLAKYPDGRNRNEQPDNTSAKFLVNGGIPLGEKTDVYFNAAYVYRKAISHANYRVPYWKKDYGLLSDRVSDPTNYTGDANAIYNGYEGYHPTFEGDLNDYNGTLGIKTLKNGWKHDISFTVGGNRMLFTVNNTVNHDLREKSPVSFKPGGFAFDHIVGNIDISKNIVSNLHIGFGSELRTETYQIIEGDESSYNGQGSNSFPGFNKRNAIKASRYNIGAYVDLTWDITKDLLLGGTARIENYSDFGSAFVWRANARYKIANVLTLRGSVSTGFRAPTLHQFNLSLNQASFQGSDIVITGLANNYSREASILGIPKLKPEQSLNLTGGVGINPNRDFSITLDYYYITITDRILYSAQIQNPGDASALATLLNQAGTSGISFFVNGYNTTTQGVDIVASYKNISLGSTKLGINFAGNYLIENKLNEEAATPEKIKSQKDINGKSASISNATVEALTFTSRPQYKFILGLDWTIKKFSINLNNTLFGPVKFRNADLGKYITDIETQFQPRVVTDLGFMFQFTSKLSASFTVQNLLNVLPKYELVGLTDVGKAALNDGTIKNKLVNDITFNGRYPVTTYDGSHFSQLGTTFQAQVVYKF